MGKFIAFILILLISIPISLLRGVVLVDLLEWFTPIRIGVVQAIGISIIFGMFTFGLKRETYDKDEGDNLANAIGLLISGLLYTLAAWLFGYVWSLFL